MQERNVTDDMSPNFAVRRKNDSMTAAELFRRIEALKIAGTIDKSTEESLKYRVVCGDRDAVYEAITCVETGDRVRLATIVDETQDREVTAGTSRRLRIQKNLASKVAESSRGRGVVNTTIGEHGALVLDVCIEVLRAIQTADEFAETEVKIYTVITKTAALNSAECITDVERRTLFSYGLTFCSILVDMCELSFAHTIPDLVSSLYSFFMMLETVCEIFVKDDTIGKYAHVRSAFCNEPFFDTLLRNEGFRAQKDRIASALRLLREEIGNF